MTWENCSLSRCHYSMRCSYSDCELSRKEVSKDEISWRSKYENALGVVAFYQRKYFDAIQWNSIDDSPEPHRLLLVTNNIDARDAFGEMSHVWLTNSLEKSDDERYGWTAYSDLNDLVRNVTHWKYAAIDAARGAK